MNTPFHSEPINRIWETIKDQMSNPNVPLRFVFLTSSMLDEIDQAWWNDSYSNLGTAHNWEESIRIAWEEPSTIDEHIVEVRACQFETGQECSDPTVGQWGDTLVQYLELAKHYLQPHYILTFHP